MEPEMLLARQVRKGINALVSELTVAFTFGIGQDRQDWHLAKAQYIRELICTMVSDYHNGRPEPWRYYEPRIDEEFGDAPHTA